MNQPRNDRWSINTWVCPQNPVDNHETGIIAVRAIGAVVTIATVFAGLSVLARSNNADEYGDDVRVAQITGVNCAEIDVATALTLPPNGDVTSGQSKDVQKLTIEPLAISNDQTSVDVRAALRQAGGIGPYRIANQACDALQGVTAGDRLSMNIVVEPAQGSRLAVTDFVLRSIDNSASGGKELNATIPLN